MRLGWMKPGVARTIRLTELLIPDCPISLSRTFAGHAVWRCTVVSIVLSATLLVGCSVTPSPVLPTSTADLLHYPYGVVYPYAESDWIEDDRQAIRERLEYLRGLGVNTTIQAFPRELMGTGEENNWLLFLDEAQRAGISVIASVHPEVEWNGQGFDFQPIRSLLSVVRGHSALLAVLGLHEPLERFNSEQLRSFYAGAKELAPELAVAHYMGDMASFDKSVLFPNRDLTAGICDICITWYYPARSENNRPVFEEESLRRTLQSNRELIRERAPDAQLWFLGQAFMQRNNKQDLRMPTPGEMQMIFIIAREEQADGFLWYPWLHNLYEQVLSDPDMELQRQAVKCIHEEYAQQLHTQ